MKSMTGYGKGVASEASRQVTIELKSVNNRYLDINSRLPKHMLAMDENIRKSIQAKIKRGNVDVFFSYENHSESQHELTVDHALAQKYTDLSRTLSAALGIENDFSVSALYRQNDIVKQVPVTDDIDLLTRLVDAAAQDAVSALDHMRETEGSAVKKDFEEMLAFMCRQTEKIKARCPLLVQAYQEKLRERINEALAGIEIDENKLINEVAFFADKADINEELSRLDSHFMQFRAALSETEAVGRKLDFLSQEMNREINTIGSKSNDLVITNIVLKLKSELEKIKEQIRNIE